jgi:hypothetical protein
MLADVCRRLGSIPNAFHSTNCEELYGIAVYSDNEQVNPSLTNPH